MDPALKFAMKLPKKNQSPNQSRQPANPPFFACLVKRLCHAATDCRYLRGSPRHGRCRPRILLAALWFARRLALLLRRLCSAATGVARCRRLRPAECGASHCADVYAQSDECRHSGAVAVEVQRPAWMHGRGSFRLLQAALPRAAEPRQLHALGTSRSLASACMAVQGRAGEGSPQTIYI